MMCFGEILLTKLGSILHLPFSQKVSTLDAIVCMHVHFRLHITPAGGKDCVFLALRSFHSQHSAWRQLGLRELDGGIPEWMKLRMAVSNLKSCYKAGLLWKVLLAVSLRVRLGNMGRHHLKTPSHNYSWSWSFIFNVIPISKIL